MAKCIEHENDNSTNSISTKEFLSFEKTCEVKDDEEMDLIFSELTKLAGANKDNLLEADTEDIELILRKAESLSLETDNLLKNGPISIIKNSPPNSDDCSRIPQIKVTKPFDNKNNEDAKFPGNMAQKSPLHKISDSPVHKTKETASLARHKSKARPFSASTVEMKKKEASKENKMYANLSKRSLCKHENLIEDMKNTCERANSLELLNVQLNDDNKALRKKLDQVNEEKHIAELKLIECEKFISRLSKQYENKTTELKTVKENESRLLAELNKERNERKNLTIRHDKDSIAFHDLQRQVKEMELILKRKHPDSVSALIVASKSSTVEDNKKKLLEERVARLEQELKDKEDHFQGVLVTLQGKFGEMKGKYESHIIDIERQLMEERKLNAELKTKINKTNVVDEAVQTEVKHSDISSQTVHKPNRASSAVAVNRMSQNSALFLNKLKEDSYLVATIKGLQAELTVKQRTIAKINRETEDLRKNLRNMQKEKEVLQNLNPNIKRNMGKKSKSSENILARMNTELEAELLEARKNKDAFVQERNSLLDTLKRTNEDLLIMKKKRLQDLHTLQLAHEKELMQMNIQIYPLQEEIKLLNRTVEILQERIHQAEDKLLRYQAGLKDVDIHAGGDNNYGSKGIYKKEFR